MLTAYLFSVFLYFSVWALIVKDIKKELSKTTRIEFMFFVVCGIIPILNNFAIIAFIDAFLEDKYGKNYIEAWFEKPVLKQEEKEDD